MSSARVRGTKIVQHKKRNKRNQDTNMTGYVVAMSEEMYHVSKKEE
jgi:hypothetical protein